jgi:hypothetical protein
MSKLVPQMPGQELWSCTVMHEACDEPEVCAFLGVHLCVHGWVRRGYTSTAQMLQDRHQEIAAQSWLFHPHILTSAGAESYFVGENLGRFCC